MADRSSPPSSPVAGTEATEQEHESLIWIDRPKYICASCGCDLALQVSAQIPAVQTELRERTFDSHYGYCLRDSSCLSYIRLHLVPLNHPQMRAIKDELVSRAFSGRAGPAFLIRSA